MDPEPRVGGGVSSQRPKKVTLINLMAEVVSDVPVATSAGFS